MPKIFLFEGIKLLIYFFIVGTLLAYTLVTVSVLILRYQPDKEEPIALTQKLDTIEESPDSETFTSEDDPYANDVQVHWNIPKSGVDWEKDSENWAEIEQKFSKNLAGI